MDDISDLADYFEPETYTLETLPTVRRARSFLYNLPHPMGIDIEVVGVDLNMLQCRIFLLPVRQNRRYFNEAL